jgi:hypothetical protein
MFEGERQAAREAKLAAEQEEERKRKMGFEERVSKILSQNVLLRIIIKIIFRDAFGIDILKRRRT